MGKMSELHIETQNIAHDWEYLLERILGQRTVGEAMALKLGESPSDREEWEIFRSIPDLAFTPKGGEQKLAVEFRMFRWQSEWRRHVRDAVSHMEELLPQADFERGIVILSIDPPADELAGLASDKVDIWGLSKLRVLAGDDDELSQALESLVSETVLDPDVVGTHKTEPGSPRGRLLVDDLQRSEPGRPGWREFERLCEHAIKHLFGREISNLRAQLRTLDGLNRMDLIGRIKDDGASFWSMIASDFSTRYVVFDAKNFVDPITQTEIEITEKYLFAKGLRAVAIVIARSGADDNARKAAEGALRENGKFILVITLDDLCKMLLGADAGEPPENLLYQRMDDMLMSMGR